MKFLFFFFVLLLSNSPLKSFAGWQIEGISIDVVPCPKKDCYISKDCGKNKPNCQALLAYSNKQKGHYKSGGANPGSSICKERFKGSVNIAVDPEGNQEGFCRFSDKSLISLGGIWK
jgi:hypothetical protein